MFLSLSERASTLVKKFISVIIKYTETGYLTVRPSGRIEIIGIDVFGINSMRLRINSGVQVMIDMGEHHQEQTDVINLLNIHKLIRSQMAHGKTIDMQLKNGLFIMHMNDHKVVMNDSRTGEDDLTIFDSLPRDDMDIFKINTRILKEVILNMSLGDGYFTVLSEQPGDHEQSDDAIITFRCRGSMVHMQYQVPCEVVRTSASSHGSIQNIFMVKYVKQLCSFASCITDTYIGMKKNFPLVISSNMKGGNLQICTSPITQPP